MAMVFHLQSVRCNSYFKNNWVSLYLLEYFVKYLFLWKVSVKKKDWPEPWNILLNKRRTKFKGFVSFKLNWECEEGDSFFSMGGRGSGLPLAMGFRLGSAMKNTWIALKQIKLILSVLAFLHFLKKDNIEIKWHFLVNNYLSNC